MVFSVLFSVPSDVTSLEAYRLHRKCTVKSITVSCELPLFSFDARSKNIHVKILANTYYFTCVI